MRASSIFSTRQAARRALGLTAVLALVATLGLSACGDDDDDGDAGTPGGGDKGKIVVGAANFAESTLLAQMFAQVLEKAGYDAEVKQLTTREVYEPALEKGSDIQAFAEYAATLTTFLNAKDNGANAKSPASTDIDETVDALQPLADKHDLAIGEPSEATDQNSFAVKEDFATENNLTSLEDLADFQGELVLGGPSECPKRDYCQKGLESKYGINFTGFKAYDTGGPLTKQALKSNKIQIGLVFSSDPAIAQLGFKVLTDPKNLQASDNIIPVMNKQAAKPDALEALNSVCAALTQDDLVRLNKAVQVDHEDAETVAKEYLQSKNLI